MIDNIKNVKERGRNAELIMKHVLKLSKIIINEKSIAFTILHGWLYDWNRSVENNLEVKIHRNMVLILTVIAEVKKLRVHFFRETDKFLMHPQARILAAKFFILL